MSVSKCVLRTVVRCCEFPCKKGLVDRIEKLRRAGIEGFHLDMSHLTFTKSIEMGSYIRGQLPADASIVITADLEDISDIASSLKASSIYLKQDFNASELRKSLDKEISIGCPYHPKILSTAIDYFGVPIYPSKERNGCGFLWGTQNLDSIRRLRGKPIVLCTSGLYASCLVPFVGKNDGLVVTDLMDLEDPCRFAKDLFDDMYTWNNR